MMQTITAEDAEGAEKKQVLNPMNVKVQKYKVCFDI